VVEHTEKSVPADAAEGGNDTITIIVSVFVGQLLPVTDQTKTLFPLSKLVICELELYAFAIVAAIFRVLQEPVPIAGVVAFKCAFVPQTIMSLPALEADKLLLTVIVTVSVFTLQEPFVMDHTNLFTPNDKLLAVAMFEFEFAILEVPLIIVQPPTPTVGIFALSVIVLVHITRLAPASANEGDSRTLISIVSTDDGHEFCELIVHVNLFVPRPKLVTVVLFDDVFEIFPIPEIICQLPVNVGPVIAARFAVVAQTCWLVPALATLFNAST
jgi:hypothetical protein